MTSLKELIKKGKAQGYITYSEFNDHLPQDIVEEEQVADIIQMLKDMGIEIKREKAQVIQLHSKPESE